MLILNQIHMVRKVACGHLTISSTIKNLKEFCSFLAMQPGAVGVAYSNLYCCFSM